MLKPIIKTLAVTATTAVSVSSLLAAEPASPSASTTGPTDTTAQMGTASGWMFQVSGDYFHFDIDTTGGGQLSSSSIKGDLYGGSVYLKAPFMKVDDWLELSYRHGSLDGTGFGGAPAFALANVHSDLDQVQLQYRWGFLKVPKTTSPSLKVDLLVGAEYLGFQETDTLGANYYWSSLFPANATGNNVRKVDDSYVMFRAGLSGTWYFWTKWSEDASKRFRIGLRGEALGGAGARIVDLTNADANTLDANGISKTSANLAYNFTGKGLLYADYKMGNLSFLLEGGYQWMEYWSTVQGEADSTAIMKGPFVRVGIGYAF